MREGLWALVLNHRFLWDTGPCVSPSPILFHQPTRAQHNLSAGPRWVLGVPWLKRHPPPSTHTPSSQPSSGVKRT